MVKEEILERYNLNLKKLEEEQKKLSKLIKIKDIFDFSLITKIGAIECIAIKNNVITSIIVFSKNMEILEQAYVIEKLRFPYIFGFKSYRFIPSMIMAFQKLQEKPDLIILEGEGINHLRLGISSHLSLALEGIPTVGITDRLFEENKTKKEDILMDNKKVGKILLSKIGSKPLYICPGNNISITTSYNLIKTMIIPPHKMPEPLHITRKYAKGIQKELGLK